MIVIGNFVYKIFIWWQALAFHGIVPCVAHFIWRKPVEQTCTT